MRLTEGLGTRVVTVHVVDADDAPLDPDEPDREERVDSSLDAVREAAATRLLHHGQRPVPVVPESPKGGVSCVALARSNGLARS